MQNFKKQVLANTGLKEILNDSKKGNIFMYGFDVKKGRSKLKWVFQIKEYLFTEVYYCLQNLVFHNKFSYILSMNNLIVSWEMK